MFYKLNLFLLHSKLYEKRTSIKWDVCVGYTKYLSQSMLLVFFEWDTDGNSLFWFPYVQFYYTRRENKQQLKRMQDGDYRFQLVSAAAEHKVNYMGISKPKECIQLPWFRPFCFYSTTRTSLPFSFLFFLLIFASIYYQCTIVWNIKSARINYILRNSFLLSLSFEWEFRR